MREGGGIKQQCYYMKNKEEEITCSSVACLVSVSFSSLSIFFVSLLICCSCSCSNVCSNCTFS